MSYSKLKSKIKTMPQCYIRKFVLEQLSDSWLCPQHHAGSITTKYNKYFLEQLDGVTIFLANSPQFCQQYEKRTDFPILLHLAKS